MTRTYISEKVGMALDDIFERRGIEEVISESIKLYRMLQEDLYTIKAGKEDILITRVIDRKIGKTYSLIKLSIKYNIPIVVPPRLQRFYQEDAQNFFNKKAWILPLSKKEITGLNNIDIVLKDQGIKTNEIIEFFKPTKIKIIGFSSMFEE